MDMDMDMDDDVTGLSSALNLDTSSTAQAGINGGGRSGFNWTAGADDGLGSVEGGGGGERGEMGERVLLETLVRLTATSCTGDSVTETLELVDIVPGFTDGALRPLKNREDLDGEGVGLLVAVGDSLLLLLLLLLLFMLLELLLVALETLRAADGFHVLGGCFNVL